METLGQYFDPVTGHAVISNPFFIRQFAVFLGERYKKQGIQEVSVYAQIKCGLNYEPDQVLINPKVDLFAVKPTIFGHRDWILPSKR